MARILLVEDLADNRELFRDVLHLINDCEVLEATDGPMAIEMARHEQPDLILMDVRLPDIDGYAVTRQIKSDPRLAAIPIVFVSAHALDTERQRGYDAGGDGYITKPIDIHHFMAEVQRYIHEAQQAKRV